MEKQSSIESSLSSFSKYFSLDFLTSLITVLSFIFGPAMVLFGYFFAIYAYALIVCVGVIVTALFGIESSSAFVIASVMTLTFWSILEWDFFLVISESKSCLYLS